MDYPDYIKDEVLRRIGVEANKRNNGFDCTFSTFHPSSAPHTALAELLIEQDFKPPVDPLLARVAKLGYLVYEHSAMSRQGEDFLRRLEAEGITITVTKKP